MICHLTNKLKAKLNTLQRVVVARRPLLLPRRRHRCSHRDDGKTWRAPDEGERLERLGEGPWAALASGETSERLHAERRETPLQLRARNRQSPDRE